MFPCPAVVRLTFTFLICINDSRTLLAGFAEDFQVVLTLYKLLVMSRLDYASQLWSPYLLKHVYLIEKVQRSFNKHITGMCYLSYSKHLEVLKLTRYREGERDMALSMCGKLSRGLVPNGKLSDPITCSFSDRRGKTCIVCHPGAG